MKPIYFIADLHLSETHPELTALFNDFMQNKAQEAQGFFFWGVFFGFLCGGRETAPFNLTSKTVDKKTDRKGHCLLFHSW